MPLSHTDLAELAEAKRTLQSPGLAIRISNVVGRPIEKGLEFLPERWAGQISEATRKALMVAMKGALLTMDRRSGEAYPRWHKVAAAVSGAAGGAFGLPALLVELPVSTTIMCRSIADIARANGESLDDIGTRLACIEVFALGGPSAHDDASETAYFTVRSALAQAVSEAAQFLASRKVTAASAPPIVRLITQVAARFQVQVSQKVAAQTVPIIGAASGALINLLFTDHFQDMSRGHFTVRRLERKYGPDEVRSAYEAL
jgi:hypothetical protein